MSSDNYFTSEPFNGSSYSSIDQAIQAYIDSLPNIVNTVYFGSVDKGSRYCVIAQKYSSPAYASGIAFAYGLTRPKYYNKVNGNWAVTVEL